MKTEDIHSDTISSSSISSNIHSIVTLPMTTTSLTDVSSVSILTSKKIEYEDQTTRSSDTLKVDNERENSTNTCSCSSCTCSNEPVSTSQQQTRTKLSYEKKTTLKVKRKKSDYLYENDDCLTHAFVTIFESSIWCMQIVYELFFKALWQALMFTKQELNRSRHRHRGQGDYSTLNGVDLISINQSARANRTAHRQLPRSRLSLLDCQQQIPDQSILKSPLAEKRRRHRTNAELRLPKSNSHYSPSTEVKTSSSNKTHVTVYSMTNQNVNRVETPPREVSSNTLGSIDAHVIVSPVSSSRCAQVTTIQNQPSGNVNLREQLTDALCRRLHEPLMFMNRGMCWGNCRGGTGFFPPCASNGLPFSHPGHVLPSAPFEQQQQQPQHEPSEQKQSPQMGDASETVSNSYSVSGSARSIGDEPLSTGVMSQHENNDQHEPSVESSVSFLSDHNRSPSQQSTKTTERNGQLIEDAKTLVDDLIRNAQKKYETVALRNNEHESSDNVVDTSKDKFESISMPSESDQQELPDDGDTLCQQLCEKLNLSDPEQLAQILRVLASNAPHVLKQQQSTNEKASIEENTLCSQLLLHPPFKPKRLIHLCPDGTIQILSAVNDDSNDSPASKQQYQLNYSNSALRTPVKPSIKYWPDQASLALEYETTTAIDLLNDVKHLMLARSNSGQEWDPTDEEIQVNGQSECTPAPSIEMRSSNVSQKNGIINVSLDDQMVTTSSDDENSLPELVFKRIIVPENSMKYPLTEISNRLTENKNNTLLNTSLNLEYVRKQRRPETRRS